MPHAESDIVIQRSPEEVFAFLADAENDVRWRSGVLDIARISGSGVGARYRQGVKGPGGRRIDADVKVTEFEPNNVIGFRAISGPVRPTGRYRLALEGTGTRVSFSLDTDLQGFKRVMSPMVQRTMDKEVAQLENLKRTLEGERG